MSQRISNEQLAKLASDIANNPEFAAYISPRVSLSCILDLADARARILELERLSASQSEALDAIDRGAKL